MPRDAAPDRSGAPIQGCGLGDGAAFDGALACAVLDALPQPTAVLDAAGTIIRTNTAWAAALAELDLDAAELGEGASYLDQRERTARSESSWSGYAARELAGVRAVLAGRRTELTMDHEWHGRAYVARAAALPRGGAVVSHDDVTERRAVQEALTHQALHDPLTGLPNRTGFIGRLRGALQRRREPGEELAVLMCDLDGFKHINESLGHALGDRVLANVARRLADQLPPNATLARFGGDEFTILHEGVCGQLESVGLARVLAAAVAQPLDVDGFELYVTLSTGIAMASDAADPNVLLREADTALYRSKGSGHAGVEVYEEALAGAALERLAVASGLRRALANGELRLVYQPIMDLDGACVRGVEALVRWQHPARGLLAPAAFIDVAEETGLIVDIGTWVLDAALAQVAAWAEEGLELSVSVNLSTRQLLDPGLPDLVADLLAEHGVAPDRLTLEITESTLLRDVEAGIRALCALRDLGVTSAIDDFGTGFSSLSYLRRLPVSSVKVDRSFVAGLADGSGDEAIIAAVIGLGRAFGLCVVAEGVETAAQHAALETLGCTAAQGFLYGRPAPAERLGADLRAAAGRLEALAG